MGGDSREKSLSSIFYYTKSQKKNFVFLWHFALLISDMKRKKSKKKLSIRASHSNRFPYFVERRRNPHRDPTDFEWDF